MSSLADRLRGVVGRGPGARGLGESGPVEPEPAKAGHDEHPREYHDAIVGVLDGEWHEEGGHRYLVIDREYGPGHRHGRVAMADAMPPAGGVSPHFDLLTGRARRSLGATGPVRRSLGEGGLLFIDLETTGLAGGAGTYAFLIGCAWFDGAIFRIRQFFLSSFGAEAVLLDGVARLAADASALVTYNGKSFDLPLLETRFVVHRKPMPMGDLPHVDMLHPARRLWREPCGDQPGADTSCRLAALECTHCGVVREGDVPGFEIPSRYFTYVRNGDARPLAAVFEHNRLDLLSLALLTSRATRLLDQGAAGVSTAREALGLGRIYEGGGLAGDARACYARAAGLDADVNQTRDGAGRLSAGASTRAEALRAYAVTCRRAGLHTEAAVAWTRVLDLRGCPPHVVREATEALAIHHEHRLRDPGAARAYALQSLRREASQPRQQALHHRLARLDRKIGSAAAGTGGAPLFSA